MMTKLMQLALILGIGFSVSACGGSKPEAAPAPAAEKAVTEPAAAPAEEAAAPEAMKTEEAATAEEMADDAAAPEIDGAVAPAAGGDDTAAKLIGTKWEIGEYKLDFKDDKTVHLNGGQLTLLTGGQGLNGSYTLVDGKLTVSAMGQTREGSWDGAKLVFDGTEGTPMQ